MAKVKGVDIVTANLGSIISICAASRKGRSWMARNVLAEDRGEQVYCDHRFGIDIIEGALDAGLRLQDSASGRTATR